MTTLTSSLMSQNKYTLIFYQVGLFVAWEHLKQYFDAELIKHQTNSLLIILTEQVTCRFQNYAAVILVKKTIYNRTEHECILSSSSFYVGFPLQKFFFPLSGHEIMERCCAILKCCFSSDFTPNLTGILKKMKVLVLHEKEGCLYSLLFSACAKLELVAW